MPGVALPGPPLSRSFLFPAAKCIMHAAGMQSKMKTQDQPRGTVSHEYSGQRKRL